MVQPDSGSVLPLSSLVLHNIAQGIFETIVEQAPLAIEELMNELEEEELSEEDELSEEEAQERGVLFREPPKGEYCALQGDSLSWSQPAVDPYLPLLSHPLASALTPEVCSQYGSWADLGNKHMCCFALPAPTPCPPPPHNSPGSAPVTGHPPRPYEVSALCHSCPVHRFKCSLPFSTQLAQWTFLWWITFWSKSLKITQVTCSSFWPVSHHRVPGPTHQDGSCVSLVLGAGPAGSSWWKKRV